MKKMRDGRENDGRERTCNWRGLARKSWENMKRLENGKAVGPDDIPVDVRKGLRESALEFLTKLYNRTMESERMAEESRDSVLIPMFKNKGDV